MRRKAFALTLISVLVFSAVAGTELANWAEANPEPSFIKYSMEIEIHSPVNKTYNANTIQLNISAWNSAGSIRPWKIMYNVDGGPFVVVYSGKSDITVELTPVREPSVWVNLPDGMHTIIAKAYNGIHYVCTNVTFSIDTLPPFLSIVVPENKTYKTSDTTLEFTAAGYSQISYSLDGKTHVPIAGNSTLRNIIDGLHNLILYGSLNDGSVFASEPVYFGIDTGRPQITFLSIKNNTTYYTYDLNLTFHISEPSKEIKYGFWGQSATVITGNVTIHNLPTGFYRLILRAEDSFTDNSNFKEIFFGVENPFPTTLVIASVVSVAIIGIGLLVYFKKRKR